MCDKYPCSATGACPGGYCNIWADIGMCRCELRVWFSSSLLWDRVYKSDSLGLEYGIIFRQTDQLVEDSSLD